MDRPSACAAAVRRLLGRDREELGRAARAFAGTLPSHEGEIDALRALYTDLLGRAANANSLTEIQSYLDTIEGEPLQA